MSNTEGPSSVKEEAVTATVAQCEASGMQVSVDGLLSKLTITYETTFKSSPRDEADDADSSVTVSSFHNSSESAELAVGCIKGADILLVLETGESLFAHSKYLKMNPYFASHFKFLEKNEIASSVRTLRVLPPFPSAFRTIVELIYNFNDKPLDDASAIAFASISMKQFVPLFGNAQFFQMQPLIDASRRFFVTNWELIIRQDNFSPRHLPEHSFSILLDHMVKLFRPANDSFTIIVYWSKEESSGFSETAQAIVAKYVKLGDITRNIWVAMARNAPEGLNLCVTPVGVVQNAVAGEVPSSSGSSSRGVGGRKS